ncbi:MAG: hypothetical protein Q8P62_05375 [Candidatus Peregrinibacteria bacterium]|nr:hypothetical protein [Candidatus Peregrinibacteria bacterium]
MSVYYIAPTSTPATLLATAVLAAGIQGCDGYSPTCWPTHEGCRDVPTVPQSKTAQPDQKCYKGDDLALVSIQNIAEETIAEASADMEGRVLKQIGPDTFLVEVCKPQPEKSRRLLISQGGGDCGSLESTLENSGADCKAEPTMIIDNKFKVPCNPGESATISHTITTPAGVKDEGTTQSDKTESVKLVACLKAKVQALFPSK